MLMRVGAAFSAMFLASTAYAGDVTDHCVAISAGAGLNDAAASCSCFEEKLSADEVGTYLGFADADQFYAEGSDNMKAAASACAPELEG